MYKRIFGKDTAEIGTHWSKESPLFAHINLDEIDEDLGCHGDYVTKAEDIKPAIKRA